MKFLASGPIAIGLVRERQTCISPVVLEASEATRWALPASTDTRSLRFRLAAWGG